MLLLALLARDRPGVAEDRLHGEQAQWLTGLRCADCQREMAEETLPRTKEATKSRALRLAPEFELGRVVDDDDIRVSARSRGGRHEVRGEDGFGSDAPI